MEQNNGFMNDSQAVKVSKFQKYRWVYLGVGAILLLAMALIMFFAKDLGNRIVIFLTGGVFISYVVIRFIPLVKTLKTGWAKAINIIELLIDLACGVLMIVLPVLAVQKGDGTIEAINKFGVWYGFFIGLVFYLRGLVYWMECSFFKTQAEPMKFFLHVIAFTAGSFVFALAICGKLDVNWFRYLFVIAALLCFIFAMIDAVINYNNYRKLYAKPRVSKKKEDKVEETKEETIGDAPQVNPAIIEPEERPQDYIS